MTAVVSNSLRLARPSRVPAALPAVSLAVGILLDRCLFLAGSMWLIALAAFVSAFWLAWALRWSTASTVALALAVAAAGGLRHHADWSWAEPDDIGRYAGDEPQLARLVGRVASPPSVRPKPPVSRTSFPEFDRTLFELEVESLGSDGASREAKPVSGRVRLSVTGHLPTLEVGDRVEVFCWMARPRPPSNPGEFDFAGWLRDRGVRVTCWTNHPDAVRRIERGSETSFLGATTRIRDSVERLVERELGPETAPIAAALLVGSRRTLPDDVRTEFAESGTLHLLAISGLHVGILATFVWFGCRLVGCGVTSATVVLLTVLAVYAVLTGGRPSVLRASMFVAIAVLGRPALRVASPLQILSLAAMLLLLVRPVDLFDPGAQLSFLAAAAIAFAIEFRVRRAASRERSLDDLVERGPLQRAALAGTTAILVSAATMAVIWGFTSPLVAYRFHVVSPVGLLVNVFLVPLLVPIMWCGYLFVLVGTTVGTGVGLFAGAFEVGLQALLRVVRVASDWSLGHRYLDGPASWWIVGFYVGVAGLLLVARRRRWPARIAAVLVFWTIAGLAVPPPDREERLRCTFLSVGHGSAVLIEFPGGRTMLFDGGSISSPEYADRVVRSAAWHAGVSRLDAVVVSHADVDHFNALPDLLEAMPVDSLIVTRPFLDFEQGFVAELCDVAAAHGTTIHLAHAGDSLQLDAEATVEVLHPVEGHTYESDNAASLVLLVTYRGRRLLLTGDLEEDGLAELLARPPIDVDVLAAPHHGSPKANPPALAAWCTPETVVVSSGSRTRLDPVREAYANAEVLATTEVGAVTVVVDRHGEVECHGFRPSATPKDVERPTVD